MNWISIIFFSLSFSVCCSAFARHSDLLAPTRVFAFIWSAVFGLASLRLSALQNEWTLSQWGYALMGPSAFILGIFCVYAMNSGSPLCTVSEMRRMVSEQKINDVRLYNFITFLFFSYIAGYFVIYLVKGYIPLFALNPSAARIEYFVFGVGLLIYHMPLVVFFSIVYHLAVAGSHAKKLRLKIMAVTSVLTYILLLQRYQLIMISLMVFTLLYYATQRIRFRTVMLFVVLVGSVIYSIATLRAGQILQTVLYKISLMKIHPNYAIITEPYMYLVMNIENFVHAVSRLGGHTFGYFTLDWFFALIQMKYPIRDYFNLVETPYLFSGYNTYTLFWTFYRDFGILGITLFPLLGGVFVGSVYYGMRRRPTLEFISFYSIIIFVMGLSFFLSPLGSLWFVYIVGWMVIIFKLVRFRDPHQVSQTAVLR